MLNKLRNFSKTKLAGLLVVIIIIPFVFWGMGSVFSGGKTNSLVKINNKNISTQDFIEYVNKSNIEPNDIKNNLEKNILQEILTQLISLNLLKMEIDKQGVIFSDKSLLDRIKQEEMFMDEKRNFSRIKYEKFLLENNTSAVDFENRIKDSEMQDDLFKYINGGIRSPNFLIKNLFLEETKEIKIQYINLEEIYEKEILDEEINKYIESNEENLLEDYINLSYIKIAPEIITESNEFNNDFFEKLDNIENDISNGSNLSEISKIYKLNEIKINEYKPKKNDDKILAEIYSKRKGDKVQLIDKEEYYLLFQINKINKQLPKLDDIIFKDKVTKQIFNKKKFNFNKNILEKIETNNFQDQDFKNIALNKTDIKSSVVNSINDNTLFNIDSLNLLYTIPENEFLLIVDNENKVYLTKITGFNYKNFESKNINYKNYLFKSNMNIKNNISSSYDKLMEEKYKVEVNYSTLDRLKNFFK